MSLVIINDVECPYCRAQAGASCRVFHVDGRGSSPRPTPHEQRRLAFRIQRASRSAA